MMKYKSWILGAGAGVREMISLTSKRDWNYWKCAGKCLYQRMEGSEMKKLCMVYLELPCVLSIFFSSANVGSIRRGFLYQSIYL